MHYLILLFFALFFSVGLYLIFATVFHVPTYRATKAVLNTVKKNKKQVKDADAVLMEKISSLFLWLLLFSVGIDMGLNQQVFGQIKKLGFKILLIPIGVVIGSLLGGSVVSFFFPQS